jgi:hypothetical protein
MILVHKNNELDTNIALHRTTKLNLEEDVRNLKINVNDLIAKLKNLDNEKNL